MMEYEEDFSRLEKYVEMLLSNIDRIKKENIALQKSLQEQEDEPAQRGEGLSADVLRQLTPRTKHQP